MFSGIRVWTTIAAVFGIASVVARGQSGAHFVIDPGHGGKDPGSEWDGIKEKDLTLDLAKRVEKVLLGRGYSTTLTRNGDQYVGLEQRAEVANRISGSVFVSLHFNSHHLRNVAGIETFYWPGSTRGQRLASFIQGELGRRIVTKNRGAKPQQLKVLEATQGPAALVECGFISNRWERQRCQSSWFKQVLAEEIAQALIRYSKLPQPAPEKEKPAAPEPDSGKREQKAPQKVIQAIPTSAG